MQSQKIILFSSGFVAGLIAGVAIMVVSGPSGGGSGVSSAPAPVTPGQPQGPDRLKLARDIEQLEEIVKKDSGNYQAWVQLGNNLFDIGEARRSIDAYQKALAIRGDDPNVWTDMGIMYRELKDFTQALAAFRKATTLSPTHPESRLNLGVVYMHDLNNPQGAIEAWEDFLRVERPGERADRIRQSVAELKARASGQSEMDKAAQELGKQLQQLPKQ